ncbi:hypothetical protein RND81_04G082000 [Saponaria officinalis]|uniref:TSPO n=1 Tax=Saponaria officinalis TaxID=3572 RepID=A0AAW1LDL6_SAPOF
MDTQNLTHRTTPTTDDDDTAAVRTNTVDDVDENKETRRPKTVLANRGLKTMGIAITLPILLTLTNIYFFGSNNNYRLTSRPTWVPPIWALHAACLGSAGLMGLSGWMVWAEGGFHRKPGMMGLYLGQLGLGLVWDPVVFGMRANGVGLMVGLGVCYALWRCYRSFREVNKTAADLVLPCLGWAGLLAFVNLKFLLT